MCVKILWFTSKLRRCRVKRSCKLSLVTHSLYSQNQFLKQFVFSKFSPSVAPMPSDLAMVYGPKVKR